MHFLGVGVPRDKAAGLAWYRKAADQGCAEAQCSLGLALYNGDGVPVDEAESVVWYRKAAEQGHAGAQYTLAYAYSYGRGVPVDKTTAEGWSRKAADQGHAKANAQFQCAETTTPPSNPSSPHEDREGERSGADTAKWYRKATELGVVWCRKTSA
jgi:TPR repeat protein